jgi:periplasmic divalent cation tolerance protein
MTGQVTVIQTTLPGTWIEAEVGAFAQLILEAGGSCVQHTSIRSTYLWYDKIESDKEWRIQIKANVSNVETIIKSIKQNHPYEVPQIIHWLAEATEEYANWIESS